MSHRFAEEERLRFLDQRNALQTRLDAIRAATTGWQHGEDCRARGYDADDREETITPEKCDCGFMEIARALEGEKV